MRARLSPLLLLGLMMFVPSLQAREHPEYQSYVPPPNEAAPTVNPDALPSASLQPFLDTHLNRILAPLGKEEFNQPWIVATLKASYDAAMATAPDSRKPAFAVAELVCNALINAMTERDKAVKSWHGSAATHSSEGVQPRGGRVVGRTKLGRDDDFFQRSVANNWTQQATALRESIQRLAQREHAAETLLTAKSAPSPPTAPAAAATPSVSVPPPIGAPAMDPVVGTWMLEGRSELMLAADHTITGSRQGSWTYTCTTDGGRNYELHWAHKDWVDYLVLSGDGKSLDGHTRGNRSISAFRP